MTLRCPHARIHNPVRRIGYTMYGSDGLIDDAKGRDLAKHLGCTDFMETSAKYSTNVEETFHSLIREIRKHNEVRLSRVDFERG